MNGGCSIIGVFSVNEKEDTVRALELLDQAMAYVSLKASTMFLQISNNAIRGGKGGGVIDGRRGSRSARRLEAVAAEREDIEQYGLIPAKMKSVARQVAAGAGDAAKTSAEVAEIRRRKTILADPALLEANQNIKQQVDGGSTTTEDNTDSIGLGGYFLISMHIGEYIWLKNLALYCVTRYLFRNFMPKSTT